jgi:hypothetical protein
LGVQKRSAKILATHFNNSNTNYYYYYYYYLSMGYLGFRSFWCPSIMRILRMLNSGNQVATGS